jgi:hypothetical protein
MYCPKCLNQTLFIKPKGVVDIYINGKKRDNGRFLYNMDPAYEEEVLSDFTNKCEEFFKWYGDFKNKETIEYIELLTVDIKCENNCRFSPMERFSAVDTIITSEVILDVLTTFGKKYNLEVELKV